MCALIYLDRYNSPVRIKACRCTYLCGTPLFSTVIHLWYGHWHITAPDICGGPSNTAHYTLTNKGTLVWFTHFTVQSVTRSSGCSYPSTTSDIWSCCTNLIMTNECTLLLTRVMSVLWGLPHICSHPYLILEPWPITTTKVAPLCVLSGACDPARYLISWKSVSAYVIHYLLGT